MASERRGSQAEPLYSARVLFDYAAVEDTEVSVFKGQAVGVREVNESGWALVTQGDRSGWVPADYLDRIDEQRASGEMEAALANLDLAVKAAEAQAGGAEEKQQQQQQQQQDEEVPLPPAPAAAAAAADAGETDAGGEEDDADADVDAATREAMALAAAAASGLEVKQCGACEKPVLDRYVMSQGRAYHAECFVCASCQTSLAGQPFVMDGDKISCEDCFYRAHNPPCGACDDVIRGGYVTALGQSWHPTCFVCSECSQPFENGQFHKHEERPYCAQHYNQLFGIACSKCGEGIEGQIFEALGKKFHEDCFTCQVDAHAIGHDQPFTVFEDKVYCAQHFDELFVQTCSRCGDRIEAQFIKVADDHFHPECWQCAGCDQVLDRATVQPRGKSFYCPACFAKAAGAEHAARTAAAAPERKVPSYMKPTRASAVKAPNLSKRGPSKAAPLNPQSEAKRGGQQFFSYTALKSGTPDGVDPSRKEEFLEPDVFFRMFKMEKAEFAKLRPWKKERMKKAVGLW